MSSGKGHYVLLFCAAFSAAGCASMMATARTDWNYTDPPWLDPSHRPLVEPTPQTLARPVAPGLPEAEATPVEPVPGGAPDEGGPPLEGPRLTAPGVAAALELAVDAPKRKQVGSAIEFRIGVWNRGESVVEDLAVEVEFDAALVFPGRPERRVSQPLGRLSPGEHREVTLTLAAEETGRHCARFLVTAGGAESAWKSVCVESVPRQVGLEIVGPPQRTVGSRAEFNVKIASVSKDVLKGMQAIVRYDAALAPREASAGARQTPGTMTWNLGDVQPGEGVQLQIEFECRVAAESACLTAELSGENFPSERVEKCISVVPLRGSIELRVVDEADPVPLGQETAYVITVQNRDLRAVRGVELSAEVPRQVSVVSAEVRQRDQMLPVGADVDGERVVFEAIEALAPDAILTYRIRVKGTVPGDGALRVRVSHAGAAEAAEVVEPTTVIRP